MKIVLQGGRYIGNISGNPVHKRAAVSSFNKTCSHIYLASQSPRRCELLRQVGVSFVPLLAEMNGDTDETILMGETPAQYVVRLAQAKARAGWRLVVERRLVIAPVLAADTIVSRDEQIFGKPKNAAEARIMLCNLAGRTHQVYTAVAVVYKDNVENALNCSEVSFTALSQEDIDAYLLTGEPFDKAGSYGIQGYAAVFINEIKGSYSGVMGLPLYETATLLRRFGWRAFQRNA